MPGFFSRFTRRWSATGIVAEPTDLQADAGFSFLGANPPTVELFNALFQLLDDKDSWLYARVSEVLVAGGITPSQATPNQMVAAIQSLINVETIARNAAIQVEAANRTVAITGESTLRYDADQALSARAETINSQRLAVEANLTSTKQPNLGYTPVQQGTGVSQTQDIIKLGWDGVNTIRATVNTTDLGKMWTNFGNPFSGAANGYQKLPSNLLMQWGQGIAISSNVSVLFPTAFTSTVLSIVVTENAAGGNWGTGTPTLYGNNRSGQSLVAFNLFSLVWNGTAWGGVVAPGISYNYIALGV